MATEPTEEQKKDPTMYGYYPDVKEYDLVRGNLQEVYVVTKPEKKYTSLIKALKAAEKDT
jgi:hypothetical protein